MSANPAPLFKIRRNSDGTYSVIDTRNGIRLVNASLESHAAAEQWCADWRRPREKFAEAEAEH